MDGIVLLSKQPGITSFSSLNNVKKALNTKKVGHTGTLDSFAQGLLVVCVGRLTRLAGNITEFDKTYEAVIKFGQETNTLEYTGTVIKTADLPDIDKLKEAIKAHTGNLMQRPPAFSAIHVDGKRASDLARKGIVAEIGAREITVYNSELKDVLCNDKNQVIACKIVFSVSKGTYIRSLARDIANMCGSAGHLIGLYRTKVGNFRIEQSAGYELLSKTDFTIESCLQNVENWKLQKQNETQEENNISKKKEFKKYVPSENDMIIKQEIAEKMCSFDPEIANMCGFEVLHIASQKAVQDFKNGKPILKSWFIELVSKIEINKMISVFSEDNDFCGLIIKVDEKHFKYQFVIN